MDEDIPMVTRELDRLKPGTLASVVPKTDDAPGSDDLWGEIEGMEPRSRGDDRDAPLVIHLRTLDADARIEVTVGETVGESATRKRQSSGDWSSVGVPLRVAVFPDCETRDGARGRLYAELAGDGPVTTIAVAQIEWNSPLLSGWGETSDHAA